jgi:hypothetical protein
MPAHWRAKAALEPTRPPPPMMETFMGDGSCRSGFTPRLAVIALDRVAA